MISHLPWLLMYSRFEIFIIINTNQYINPKSMQEKLLLINSMQKLINHIVLSKKNQEEIFASLSKNDFKKIISNLEDENLRLRKISLALISQLLHNHPALKDKFCQIMNIPLCPGRIALNSKLSATYNRNKHKIVVDMTKNIRDVFILLKQPIHESQKNCLFWFINYETSHQQPVQLEYFTLPQGQVITINDLMDPVNSMIGFYLPERNNQRKMEPTVTPTNSNTIEPKKRTQYQVTGNNRLINNFMRPTYKPEQMKPTVNPSLNSSLHMASTGPGPGYSTDRQIHYIPKSNVYPQNNLKVASFSMYQEPPQNYYVKNPTQVNPNQPKPNNTSTLEVQNQRARYTGIKLYTNPISTKHREVGKYFQETSLHSGATTSTNPTGKTIEFVSNNPNGVGGGGGNVNKTYTYTQKQRGYETLRQKNIIQKYPY